MEEIIIEADIMKPLLFGDDVKRYSKIVNTYYVIYPHYITSENKTKPYEEKELKSRFPLAYKYFCNFKEELTRRKIKNKNNSTYWYALNRARQIEMFEQAKIIFMEIHKTIILLNLTMLKKVINVTWLFLTLNYCGFL